MGSGGYRAGAGRPRKPVSEKILNGNPGKRPIEVLQFDEGDELPKEPPIWLTKKAKEIYKNLVEWLEKIGCTKGILPYNVEEYAHCKSRWLESEGKCKNIKSGIAGISAVLRNKRNTFGGYEWKVT